MTFRARIRQMARAFTGRDTAAIHGQIQQLQQTADELAVTMTDLAYRTELRTNPRYSEAKRLTQYGWKGFSQNDEDGILAEILRRVGEDSRQFVELGVGDGLENNTCGLLVSGWRGGWVESDAGSCAKIEEKFAEPLKSGQLQLHQGMVTAENIEQVLGGFGIDRVDVLSIDIDGNDYWVWKALQSIHARVVVIEYNAKFGADAEVIVPYTPQLRWNAGSSYFGSSLRALQFLGQSKGYSLVGCSFAGVNAFFVRDDIMGEKFAGPYTADNHFEPARYFLRFHGGHRSDFGTFVHGISASMAQRK